MSLKQRKLRQSGQAMVEYAVMLAMFASICTLMMLLLAAFMEHGWRILSLVAWEPFV